MGLPAFALFNNINSLVSPCLEQGTQNQRLSPTYQRLEASITNLLRSDSEKTSEQEEKFQLNSLEQNNAYPLHITEVVVPPGTDIESVLLSQSLSRRRDGTLVPNHAIRSLVIRWSHQLSPKAVILIQQGFPNLENLSLSGIRNGFSLSQLLAGTPQSATPQTRHFKYLRHLEASHSEVSDTDLDGLSLYPDLQFLNLNGNPLHDAGISRIAHLTHLQELFLGGTGVSVAGFRFFSRMSHLHTLDLSTPQLSPQPTSPPQERKELEQRAIQSFSKLTQIRTLRMGGRDLQFIPGRLSFLRTWIHLQSLQVPAVSLADVDLQHLSALKELINLDLSSNRLTLTGEGLRHVSDTLTTLHLAYDLLSESGFASLPRFRHLKLLNLTATGMRDAHLMQIGELVSLQTLYLSQNPIVGHGLSYLHALEQMETFHLAELTSFHPLPPFQEFQLLNLVSFPKLVELSLDHLPSVTDWTATVLLEHLPKLRILLVGGTQITDEGIRTIVAEHPDLTFLNLVDLEKVTARSVPELERLAHLEELYLGKTTIQGSQLTALKQRVRLNFKTLKHQK